MSSSYKRLVTLFLSFFFVPVTAVQFAYGQDRGCRHRDYRLDENSPWHIQMLKQQKTINDYVENLTNRIYRNWKLEGIEEGRAVIQFAISKDGNVSDFKVSTSFGEKEIDDELISVIQNSAPFPSPPSSDNQPMMIGFTFDFKKKFSSSPVTPRGQYIKALRLIKSEYYDRMVGTRCWNEWSFKRKNNLHSFTDSQKAINQVILTLKDPRCKLLKVGEEMQPSVHENISTQMSEMTRALGFSKMLSNDTGYIRPNEFSRRSIDEWAYELMNVEKCRYLVLDLRNNRGGLIEPVRRISSMFLKEGKVIYQLKKNRSNEVISAEKDMLMFKGKMVILVNESTGGSAEIIASALKDNNGTKILGTRTKGQGQMMATFNLSNLCKLALCTGEIYSPANKRISDGLIPDVTIPLSSEQVRTGKGSWWNYYVIPRSLESLPFENDIQLMLALRTLKNL